MKTTTTTTTTKKNKTTILDVFYLSSGLTLFTWVIYTIVTNA
jgi:hypothetical protein